MVKIKSPLADLTYDDQTGLYIGALERQVLGLTIQDLRFRALLELITGEEWDDMKTEFEQNEIEAIAVRAVEKKLGVKHAEARKIVRERKEAAQNATDH